MLSLITNYSGDFYTLLLMLLFFAVAVVSALVFHEYAHGFMAVKCGDMSPKFAGRLTLNPAKHLDPVGTLFFVLVGFGWANPVPINPNNFHNRKKGLFLVSIAGVVTNLIIAFISSFFFVLCVVNGVMVWSTLFQFIMLINIAFAVFNLIPIPPLDGFNVIVAIAPNSRFVRFMRENSMMMVILLLLVLQVTNVLGIMQSFLNGLFLDFWQLFI